MHRIEAIAVYQPTTNSKQLAQKRPELANESQNDPNKGILQMKMGASMGTAINKSCLPRYRGLLAPIKASNAFTLDRNSVSFKKRLRAL